MSNLEKLIDIHFNGMVKIIQSQKTQKDDYDLFYSPLLQDYYWNYAYLKNRNADLKQVWQNVKQDMEKLERRPALYVLSNLENSKIETELQKLYTDVWMIFEDIENFGDYESRINVEISRVRDEEKNQFIQSIMDGFSDADDPYEILPEEYRIIYELEFAQNGEYSTLEYGGKYNGEMIATANVWYKGDCAIIYSVSTKKEFQKQGVCKKLMSYIMKDLQKNGIKVACVQTEKGFYTEKVYQKMGFFEVMFGKVYGEKG